MDKKIKELNEQLEDVLGTREKLSEELNKATTIAVKLQGALEVLEGMKKESEQKKEEKK
tara:strand:- start:465 stop:641 length:177 start_codon:yes stop_codon:yes gene_type:complete